MKLRVFHAGKGDCLLLTTGKGTNILIDGGMRDAYLAHVQPHLAGMARRKEAIDLVYISHIDQDHIAGILQLLNDTMAWRVHDYRSAQGTKLKPPANPRMPVVGAIWHNAFSDMIGANAGPAVDLLAQSAMTLIEAAHPSWRELASEHHELAYSVAEAIQVSRRVGADQLGIPLNEEFGGRLIMVRTPSGPEVRLGGCDISVVGPFEEDVAALRDDWNDWLRTHKKALATLRAKAKEDAAKIAEGDQVVSELDIALKQLGDRGLVTAPNLASVMLLVQEGAQRFLLTGDGHADDILAGLEFQDAFDANGIAHFDVLKVQHHGSEHNIHEDFCRLVTADNYVFCGNGQHENPDLDALEVLFKANAENRPGARYKLWFNSDDTVAPAGTPAKHMKELMRLVNRHVSASAGRVTAEFSNRSSFLVQ